MSRCLWVFLALIVGCSGSIGDGGGAPRPDGGPNPPRDSGPDVFTACGDTGLVLLYLEERCASAACHGNGGQAPVLTRDGIAALSGTASANGQPYVVAGDPDSSWLYRKMVDPTEGALMPLGVGTPVEEAALIRQWIEDGAPVACDALPPTRVPYDPNTLDQATLFTCEDASAPRSSPARIRRIERTELVQIAIGEGSVNSNPLSVPDQLPYSTYAEGVSLTPSVLDLYTLQLPAASYNWTVADPQQSGGQRMEGIYRTPIVACMTGDAPDDACIDRYVDVRMRRGTTFRAPTEGERSRARALLTSLLASETPGERQHTLAVFAQATLMTYGALFRAELGEEEDGRRRLSNDEMALALGRMISTAPPGVPFKTNISGRGITEADPDWDFRADGRLARVRYAADDGTIQDAATRRELIRYYFGGNDATRSDLRATGSDTRRLETRGEYWLAPTIAAFFREWLDYSSASTSFKDDPGATSRWAGRSTTTGFSNLQSTFYAYEANIVQQMDDLIARLVTENAAGGGPEFFRTMMTTRLWRLPSNTATTNDTPCTENAQCASDRCYPNVGLCGGSSSLAPTHAARVYDLETSGETYSDVRIDDTLEGRWVQMPPDERIGVLTHPAWLASHGGNFEDDASAIFRGRWIREYLFSESVPDLSNVQVEAQLVPSAPDLSARERLQQSTEEGEHAATCLGCHSKMNALGFAFEAFNHAGFLRVEDHGSAPNSATTITNLPDPSLNRDYANTAEFIEALADSAYARRGFIRHAFRYFMGRDETLADGCTLAEMEAALDESFVAMLEVLVASETFAYRHTGERP